MSKRKGKSKRTAVATRLPVLTSRTVQLSEADAGDKLTFRKRILPDDTIVYPRTRLHPGGPVKFDSTMRQQLIAAFDAGAYDNPPLQWATPTNAHNMDPKLTGGSIIGLSEARDTDVDGPGLYADVRAHSKKDARILRRNPALGVSPEIVSNLQTVHGKRFPVALRHVLGVLDPRVRALGPWRAVSLSSDAQDEQMIDLSESSYEGTARMSKKNGKKSTADRQTVVTLSDDELGDILDLAADELEGDSGDVLSLAAGQEALRGDLESMRAGHAADAWASTRRLLQTPNADGYAISPAVLDLAAPLLSLPDVDVIQLSDGDDLDPRAVLRDVLEEIYSGNAVINLSAADGDGRELQLAAADGENPLVAGVQHLKDRFDR